MQQIGQCLCVSLWKLDYFVFIVLKIRITEWKEKEEKNNMIYEWKELVQTENGNWLIKMNVQVLLVD